jgi:hypothetical protein
MKQRTTQHLTQNFPLAISRKIFIAVTVAILSSGSNGFCQSEPTLGNDSEAGTANPPPAIPEDRPAFRAEPPNRPIMRAEPITPPTKIEPTKIEPAKTDDRLSIDLKQNCQRHFPGQIQAEVRAACASAGNDFERLGKLGSSLAQTRCRLQYGEEPRLVMACLIGTNVADELGRSLDGYKRKLQLCAESYPVHNEIDAALQESCLTGVHLPSIMKTDGHERFEACGKITPERSFIGPCAVGLSLAQELTANTAKVDPVSQNKMCEKFFNLNRFHKGYRACLSARSLAPELPAKYGEAIKGCANIMSEANNDIERAACIVGLSIFRHLQKHDDVNKHYQKCGDNKVTYQDRDFLACLTAASLLDFTDKNGAESGCREVFKELKSRSRGDCVNSLSLF